MKAAIITGHRELTFSDMPFPETAPAGAALVKIRLTGICGSDVGAYRDGEEGYPPVLSGHEWVGDVLAIGEGVDHLTVGDRVVIGTPPACGTCAMCMNDHWERCLNYSALSFGQHPLTPHHGGYAERIVVPAESLIPVPAALSDVEAAMVEPATVALHAVRRRAPRLGDIVVVIGAGPVGLFAAQLAQLAGASEVILVEPRGRRREIAERVGITTAVHPDDAETYVQSVTGGLGADLVYECAGVQSAITLASTVARPGAVIELVGIPTTAVEVMPLAWSSKELTIDTSLAHHHHEFSITMSLMAAGKLNAEALHDRTVELDDLDAVFQELASGADLVKVLVTPSPLS